MYTGNTSVGQSKLIQLWIYPCVYREHDKILCFFSWVTGLSLCIQGTPHFTISKTIIFRFIPVYTGNTSAPGLANHTLSVYPCVYREHFVRCEISFFLDGLSLCIQGTLLQRLAWRLLQRFIPVYTGNTQLELPEVFTVTVYPCVYREHNIRKRFFCYMRGLSLCIQGTHINLEFRW